MAYLVAVKENHKMLGGFFAGFPRFEIVIIIPAVLVERVADQGRTQQKPDLCAGHADFDLLYEIGIEQVALLNIDAIDAAAGQGSSDEHRRNQAQSANPRNITIMVCMRIHLPVSSCPGHNYCRPQAAASLQAWHHSVSDRLAGEKFDGTQ